METFIKAVAAGVCIAIAAMIYSKVGGAAGAALFSLGLYIILQFKLKLFTGFAAYIDDFKSFKESILIFLGNFLGAGTLLFYSPVATDLFTYRMDKPTLEIFINSIICGMLIYIAVTAYKQNFHYMVVLSVAGFILFGAEHCIADICYMIMARNFEPRSFDFILFVAIGNVIGAKIWRKIHENY